jgi:hypothetical protein
VSPSEVYAGYKPTVVSKHKAPNNVHLKQLVDRLTAAGDHEAADTIVWLVWWSEIQANREKYLIADFYERVTESINETMPALDQPA